MNDLLQGESGETGQELPAFASDPIPRANNSGFSLLNQNGEVNGDVLGCLECLGKGGEAAEYTIKHRGKITYCVCRGNPTIWQSTKAQSFSNYLNFQYLHPQAIMAFVLQLVIASFILHVTSPGGFQ